MSRKLLARFESPRSATRQPEFAEEEFNTGFSRAFLVALEMCDVAEEDRVGERTVAISLSLCALGSTRAP